VEGKKVAQMIAEDHQRRCLNKHKVTAIVQLVELLMAVLPELGL
jgi:hypothetical protein